MCEDERVVKKARNEKFPKCERFFKEVAAIKETKDISLLLVKIDRYQELIDLATAKLSMFQVKDYEKIYNKLLKKTEAK